MKKAASSNSKYDILINFLKEKKWKYILGMAMLAGVNLLQLAVPKITGDIINKVVGKSIGGQTLFVYSGLILVIALLVFLLNYLSRIQIVVTSNLFDFVARNKLFSHIETLSMKFFNKNNVGDIMALSSNDLGAIRMAIGRGIMLIANTLILIIASIIIMGRTMNMRLTIVLFIPFPILIFIMLKFGTIINRRFRTVQESFANITRKAQENISGIRVVKAFAQEDAEVENFAAINQENYKINMDLVKIQGVFQPLISLLTNFSYFIVMLYGGLLVIDKSITIGDFVAFNSYVGVIVRPIGMIGNIISFVQRGKASLERITDLLHVKADVVVHTTDVDNNDEKFSKLNGKIEFKDVTFAYPESQRQVLKNISFTIEQGKTLGVVGRVGYGKSTLANLIMRFYDVQSRGQLFIDDIDILDMPIEVLRDNIGYVPQENFLFSQSIRDNIAFSPYEFTDEQVEEAAKVSQVYDNIVEFKEKFETLLGERGVNVSGGQKQRISIARAIIKNPSILILDDCLSSVDTETEKKIMDGLNKYMSKRTCIIIAHRISTIMNSDEIVVLEKGEIVERGTHQQLLSLQGSYYDMYQRQLLEDQVSECS